MQIKSFDLEVSIEHPSDTSIIVFHISGLKFSPANQLLAADLWLLSASYLRVTF